MFRRGVSKSGGMQARIENKCGDQKSAHSAQAACKNQKSAATYYLHCPHDGRVKALHAPIHLIDQWMKDTNTDPDQRVCIFECATGQGRISMEEICTENNYNARYNTMAQSEDSIGWRMFMEGMVCKEIRAIQSAYFGVKILRGNNAPMFLNVQFIFLGIINCHND